MQHFNRKILLFIDNPPCHDNMDVSHVAISFFPANCSATLQPLDQEIIRSFKTIYRKLFLQRLLTNIKEIINIKDIIRKVSILDSLYWIQKTRVEVSTETIVNCFHRAGLPNYPDYSIDTNIEDKDMHNVKKLFLMTGEHHISPGDYADIDNSADPTFISQSESISEHIVKEFLTNKEEGEEEDNHEKENITTNKILFNDE